MYAITSMAMRKFLAKERMEKDRRERERQALLALELYRLTEALELQDINRDLRSAKWESTGK